ncbi:hypothetical protein [Pseudomonas phage vB_Pa-PAC2]
MNFYQDGIYIKLDADLNEQSNLFKLKSELYVHSYPTPDFYRYTKHGKTMLGVVYVGSLETVFLNIISGDFDKEKFCAIIEKYK